MVYGSRSISLYERLTHVGDRHQRRMDAIIKSDHTYVEIMAFIKESEEMK